MTDQPTVEDTKPVGAPAVVPEPNVLETTTVKDGNLPINVSAPTALPSAADPGSPTVAAPETPVLVTESEVSSTQANGPGLAEEVESLSGEIQALEAKIDRLTGNVKPVTESQRTDSSVEMPPKEQPAQQPIEQTAEKPAEPVPAPLSPQAPAPASNKPESKTVGINDIYSKVAQRQKEAETSVAPSTEDAQDVSSGSSIGTIGEVLAVFGVIIFMIMGAFPFYKTMLPESITEAIRSIGWPTAVVSLAIGFLMSLFSHGKLATKIFTVIILLLAVILYLGVAGFQNYLGPLGGMLDSAFTFYR
ncbi:MAG: hypothetical protein NUV80_06035 [Candidatus Berkelbacteria bacterium]|nr:hypothetical protein [Candidatus Berkelbacteria bacterium]MCR4308090.1 hypothetical protein [Candidatus Berkelbacteria bacterium]